MERRDFLTGLAASGVLAGLSAHANTSAFDIDPKVIKISTFDYDGVRLHDSRWNDQYLHAREFYSTSPMTISCMVFAPRQDCPRQASRWEDGATRIVPPSSASG